MFLGSFSWKSLVDGREEQPAMFPVVEIGQAQDETAILLMLEILHPLRFSKY